MNAFSLKYLVPQVQAGAVRAATEETHAWQGRGCEGSSQKGRRSTIRPEEGGSGGYKEESPVSVEIAEGTLPLKRFPPSALLHSKRYTG